MQTRFCCGTFARGDLHIVFMQISCGVCSIHSYSKMFISETVNNERLFFGINDSHLMGALLLDLPKSVY